jgi:hypothetical protein
MSEYKFKPTMFGPKTYFSLANKLMNMADLLGKGPLRVIDFVLTPPEKWIDVDVWDEYNWDSWNTRSDLATKARTVASAIYSEGAIF